MTRNLQNFTVLVSSTLIQCMATETLATCREKTLIGLDMHLLKQNEKTHLYNYRYKFQPD